MGTPVTPAPTGARLVEASLPLTRPYRSGTTAMAERRVLLVGLTDGEQTGWGECSPVPGYSTESLDDCRAWLAACLADPAAADVGLPSTGPPSARFALDTALTDLAARRDGRPLWECLGGTGGEVPVGAVIGLDPPVDDLEALATELAAAGYRRIKLKVDATRNLERVAAVRRALPGHDLAVDANGTLDPDAAAGLDRFGLSFIEQPFPAADLAAHARLAQMIDTPVCLDESIGGVTDAARAIDTGAGSMVNIKPARIGGLQEAIAVHDLAAAAGWSLWCGGMLETGIGKAAALAIASLPGMTAPADLPPSARHFAADVIDPGWEMSGGTIRLPDRPGLGVAPDPRLLERVGTVSTRFGDDVGLPA